MRVLAVSVSVAILLAGRSLDRQLVSSASPVTATHASVHVSLPPSNVSSDLTNEDLTRVVQRYCVVCHNDAARTGDLTLQSFDVAAATSTAEVSEKMIRKLRVGMMPPPGMPRPSGDTLQMLAATLETELDRAAREAPNPGSRRFQRLNRAEYESVIRDLLGLYVDAENWLPPDTYLGSFDNGAAVQTLSVTSLEAYMRAAGEISRIAVGTTQPASITRTHEVPKDVTQHAWDHVEGAPYGTRGGMVVKHTFPADGDYVFSAKTQFGSNARGEELVVAVAGEVVAVLPLEHSSNINRGTLEYNNLPIQTDPIYVPAGQHDVAFSFAVRNDGPYEDRLSPHDLSFTSSGKETTSYGLTVLPHVRELAIAGPRNVRGLSATQSRERIFSCSPVPPSGHRSCAESVLSRLATKAYRRPVTPEDMTGIMDFYDEGFAQGFEEGVRRGLEGILSSPFFLFRYEFAPEDVAPGEDYRLDDLALASRLAMFLWNGLPDEELIDLGQDGWLSDEQVLEQQVRRMLADPRSESLATRFAAQWLRLQDLEVLKPDPFLYPGYSLQLAQAMRRETELLFDHLVREDLSFLELYTADYTFANRYLARHYGIPFNGGNTFQRVPYADENRRGILGHGSVLALTSLANRTSPVLRGKWVMEVLLGSPPPPPPPGVPSLEETSGDVDGRVLTTRERMELHRENPVCNACHQFMDPIGLALDNFDVTGKWRIRENGNPLDTRGNFYDGTPVATPADLQEVILRRPIPLVRTFTQNLLAYATGRSITHMDAPAVRAIQRQAEANNYRMSSFILGVVKSDAFRMKRIVDVMSDTSAGGQ